MSEGKTIIDISKELTDKNFTFSDYFIEVDTADETYKMSFETYFEGILAPDGSGNIDVGNSNLNNVGNIDATGLTVSGIIKVYPNIKLTGHQANDASNPVLSYETGDYNHILDIQSGSYISVDNSRIGKMAIQRSEFTVTLLDDTVSAVTSMTVKVYKKVYKYDGTTETFLYSEELLNSSFGYLNLTGATKSNITYSLSNDLLPDSSYSITTEDLRIYIIMEYTSLYDIQVSMTGTYELQSFR